MGQATQAWDIVAAGTVEAATGALATGSGVPGVSSSRLALGSYGETQNDFDNCRSGEVAGIANQVGAVSNDNAPAFGTLAGGPPTVQRFRWPVANVLANLADTKFGFFVVRLRNRG